MRQVFLAPRSNKSSRENFESTILAGRSYSDIELYLDPAQKEALSRHPMLGIWGLKESLRPQWDKIEPGDYVIFYDQGVFTHSARIVATRHDEQLGRKLWTVEDDNPWAFLFFVENVQEINIPFRTIVEAGAYKNSWNNLRGFTALRESAVQTLSSRFGSIEKLLHQEDGSVIDMTQPLEEVYEISDTTKLIRDASNFVSYKPSHVLSVAPHRVRVENRPQKQRVAQIEGYSCQLCGWSLEWRNSQGKRVYRIDIDHITEKGEGGGEELSNLWALCPNCHAKKTVGVIVVDKEKGIVKENGKKIPLDHDKHLGWS